MRYTFYDLWYVQRRKLKQKFKINYDTTNQAKGISYYISKASKICQEGEVFNEQKCSPFSLVYFLTMRYRLCKLIGLNQLWIYLKDNFWLNFNIWLSFWFYDPNNKFILIFNKQSFSSTNSYDFIIMKQNVLSPHYNSFKPFVLFSRQQSCCCKWKAGKDIKVIP